MRRSSAIGVVLVCCLLVAVLVVVLSPGRSAAYGSKRSAPLHCPPASLGQQSVTNEIETILQERCLRGVYGGDEVERSGRVHIFVAHHGEGLIRAALAPIATPEAYTFSAVPHTWAALRTETREVSAVALDRRPAGRWTATLCYPDPARSSLIVEVVRGDLGAARSQLHARFPDVPIVVVRDTTGGGIHPA